MFERFTDKSRDVVRIAQDRAKRAYYHEIGTEFILLALLEQGDNVAADALTRLGIDAQLIADKIAENSPAETETAVGHIPFTARSRVVMENAMRESILLGHNYIGPEHILLSIVREGQDTAAQILVKLGADLNRVRQQVIYAMTSQTMGEDRSESKPGTFTLSSFTITLIDGKEKAAAYYGVIVFERFDPKVGSKRLRKAIKRYNRLLDELAELGNGIRRLRKNGA